MDKKQSQIKILYKCIKANTVILIVILVIPVPIPAGFQVQTGLHMLLLC